MSMRVDLDELKKYNQKFIGSVDASKVIGICKEKVQEFCRVRYKDFPGIMDGGYYKVNKDMIESWCDRITEDGVKIPTLKELRRMESKLM